MIIRIMLILVLGSIAYLSLTPTLKMDLGNDKIGHLLAYAVLTMNLGIIMHPNKRRMALFGILAFTYGLLMEGLQHFVPGRTVSVHDLMANGAGVIIGFILLLFFGNWIHSFLRKSRII